MNDTATWWNLLPGHAFGIGLMCSMCMDIYNAMSGTEVRVAVARHAAAEAVAEKLSPEEFTTKFERRSS